ncbi:RNA polymerase sigma factor [Robertkochia flava]|uniref:RNA polymerase sigma factor n=1 Tax=Robertkochia flava TaxID=3447986 RepID=UPI001CCCE6DB|nr:RNA polymerase sigma factor [Robertkochia marina]
MQLKKLVSRCIQQDRKAQEELYRIFGDKLYSVCLKYSRNRVEAEDNLQDSFVTIFEKIGQYHFKGSFEGWLKRITINTVLQKYRKDGVLYLVSTQELPDTAALVIEEDDTDLDTLLKLIQELPDQYRLTFNLYVLDGYSHREISEMLGISTGTSKSNLARAKALLRTRIREIIHQKEAKSSNQ